MNIALRDGPFQYGPWGEALSIVPSLFLNSTVSLHSMPDSGLVPAQNEPSIPLDWSLPLTAESQALLFRRMRITFERATGIVESKDRRKYRMKEEDLQSLRNVACLYVAVRDFMSTRFSWFTAFDEAMHNGSSRDAEFQQVLESRPPCFSLSMLPCFQKEALDQARAGCRRTAED